MSNGIAQLTPLTFLVGFRSVQRQTVLRPIVRPVFATIGDVLDMMAQLESVSISVSRLACWHEQDHTSCGGTMLGQVWSTLPAVHSRITSQTSQPVCNHYSCPHHTLQEMTVGTLAMVFTIGWSILLGGGIFVAIKWWVQRPAQRCSCRLSLS